MTIAETQKTDFYAAITAAGRSSEVPESADAYGWLVGSWEVEVYDYKLGDPPRHSHGEVHFAWTLEGRAVQDVWIVPRRSERSGDLSGATNLYGVTLRVWDPSIQAWRVTWTNPVRGTRDELIGRWSGKDVVQVGQHADGTPIRWIFTEITGDSFHWTGEALEADGRTWKMEGEFRAKRMR
jgi:hypothetical protein